MQIMQSLYLEMRASLNGCAFKAIDGNVGVPFSRNQGLIIDDVMQRIDYLLSEAGDWLLVV